MPPRTRRTPKPLTPVDSDGEPDGVEEPYIPEDLNQDLEGFVVDDEEEEEEEEEDGVLAETSDVEEENHNDLSEPEEEPPVTPTPRKKTVHLQILSDEEDPEDDVMKTPSPTKRRSSLRRIPLPGEDDIGDGDSGTTPMPASNNKPVIVDHKTPVRKSTVQKVITPVTSSSTIEIFSDAESDGVVPLDRDDSMYHGSKPKKPSTPVATRGQKRLQIDLSPTADVSDDEVLKKVKISATVSQVSPKKRNVQAPSTPTSSSARKMSPIKAPKFQIIKKEDVPKPTLESSPFIAKKVALSNRSRSKPDDDAEFSDSEIVVKSPGAKQVLKPKDKKAAAVLLEDALDTTIVVPEVCEVYRSDLTDPKLLKSYKGLTPLNAAILTSTWDSRTGGQARYSGILQQSDRVIVKHLYNAVTFKNHKCYVNLSRVDPRLLSNHSLVANNSRFAIYMKSGGPAICLSTIVVGQSHLLEKSGPGLLSKKIDGTFLSLEWERFVAVVCSIFGHSEMQAQISVTNLTFATRSEAGGATNKSQPTGMFGAAPSPASLSPFKRKADSSSSSVKLILDPDDIVPVYDARIAGIDFADLDDIGERLPSFEEELPQYSTALVAYTVSTYKQGKAPKLWVASCNVQWVAVLALPKA